MSGIPHITRSPSSCDLAEEAPGSCEEVIERDQYVALKDVDAQAS